MRTKALLVTAASALIGASAMAQVVSVNVVGFINLSIPANGYALVANQLNAGVNNSNNLSAVVPTYVQDGKFVKWDVATQGYKTYVYDSGAGWLDGDTLEAADPAFKPGEGAFLFNPGAATTVTLVGEVPQGNFSVPLAGNGYYSMVSSVPPLAANAVQMAVPTAQDMKLIKWVATGAGAQSYKTWVYDTGAGWLDGDTLEPSIPDLAVGDGFFIMNTSPTALNWAQSFTVAP
jgi:hypothetical protein